MPQTEKKQCIAKVVKENFDRYNYIALQILQIVSN